ncbi:hypothetical protein ACN08A_04280 [Enterococcus cecorum]|uniref:hypothetical protein n=1 Tax=Enterococcus cecorum TaxID=44008 RepID=UPI003B42949A
MEKKQAYKRIDDLMHEIYVLCSENKIPAICIVANEDNITANTAAIGYTSQLATLISAALMDNFNEAQLQIIFNKIMNHLKE